MVQLVDKTGRSIETFFGDLEYGQCFLSVENEIYLKTSETTAVRWSKYRDAWVHASISSKGEAEQYSFDFGTLVIPYKTTITIERI